MLTQVTEFPKFKQKSKMDGFVWMATFLAVVIVAIDIGLLVGIVLSVLCIFINSLKAHICLLGNIPDTDMFLDIERFEKAKEVPLKKIFHYSGGINFATKTSFRNRLCRKLGIDLLEELKNADRKDVKPKGKTFSSNLNFQHLILDFSGLSFIDPSSVNMLENVIRDFIKLNVQVSIAGCSTKIYETLINNEFSFIHLLYPTIHDAIRSH
jgi:solute carrier family 26, other